MEQDGSLRHLVGRSAVLHPRQTLAPYRLSRDPFTEAGDQRLAPGHCLLYRGQRQRRLMAFLVIPDFGDPDGVRVRMVLRDDVALTARHGRGTLQQDCDQCITLSRDSSHLSDQSVHFLLSFWR